MTFFFGGDAPLYRELFKIHNLHYRLAGGGGSLTLSYASKINGYLYPQRVSLPWKFGTLFCILTSWVGCDADAVMLTIMAVRHDSNLEKVGQKAITICSGLSHPTRSLSRIDSRGEEGPKARKGTLRPDFQANTRLEIFFKANATTRYRKEVARKPINS